MDELRENYEWLDAAVSTPATPTETLVMALNIARAVGRVTCGLIDRPDWKGPLTDEDMANIALLNRLFEIARN